jgi:hypothetical protein
MDMNRHERRAANKRGLGTVIEIDYGRFIARDPNAELPVVECYACGTPHKAAGFGRIRDGKSMTDVSLCEPCLVSDEQSNAVLRKYMGTPKLEVRDGGNAMPEQIEAISLKLKHGVSEH